MVILADGSIWDSSNDNEDNEYSHIIEKACKFWEDHLATSYGIDEDAIESSIEEFKLAMKL